MAKERPTMDRSLYEAGLLRLQTELVEMQEWVRVVGARVVIIFEGRDATGKGRAVKHITEYFNPRTTRVVALLVPTERERIQWCFQCYITHLPATGEICLFDRSWYNCGGVEYAVGYCTPEGHQRFLQRCPVFERMLVDDGILLCKYRFFVPQKEQYKRFKSWMTDPMRYWKLSPIDLKALSRWEGYSWTRDEMFVHTDIDPTRWHVAESAGKRKAHLSMIHHLLGSIPYEHVERPEMTFPKKSLLPSSGYRRTGRSPQSEMPDYVATLNESSVIGHYVNLEDQGVG